MALLLALALARSVDAEVRSADRTLAAIGSALQAGEPDKAMALLNGLPQPEAGSADAHNLRCRVYFSVELWDQALSECTAAVNMDGRDSNYQLWLGRSLGEKADKASFVTAYGLAKRAREAFELSIQLDPANVDALADLGDFYVQAPAVVGGGYAKAEVVAAQLDRLNPAQAHKLRGFIAEGNKDYGTAERELKTAMAASAHPAMEWMTLASFYRRRQRWEDMQAALANGYALAERDRQAAEAFYNGASVLIKADRDPDLAIRMLHAYLAAPLKSEQAPAFKAEVQLAKLESHVGDTAAAERARAAALAMASEYKPAQDLKF